LTTFPEITDPDFVIALATITRIVAGTLPGGLELLPGSVFHVPPQVAGFGVVIFANPLKESGAEPPLKLFCFAHCAPQNITDLPTTAFLSPMTKLSA
jgi:hypothetical protein